MRKSPGLPGDFLDDVENRISPDLFLSAVFDNSILIPILRTECLAHFFCKIMWAIPIVLFKYFSELSTNSIFMIIAGVVFLVLSTQKWFWHIVFGLASFAALFWILANIIHFQILAAVWCLVLMFIFSWLYNQVDKVFNRIDDYL